MKKEVAIEKIKRKQIKRIEGLFLIFLILQFCMKWEEDGFSQGGERTEGKMDEEFEMKEEFYVSDGQKRKSREVREMEANDEDEVFFEEQFFNRKKKKVNQESFEKDSFYPSYSSRGGDPENDLIVKEESAEKDSEELGNLLKGYKTKESEDQYMNPLALNRQDVRVEKIKDGVYDLIIRKKPYIHSILLTNYFWDKNYNKYIREYGLRSLTFNSVNGNEKRLYKKTFIGKEHGLYFLVDSTTEEDKYFGASFRIRIPRYVVYGYRSGKDVYGVLRTKDGFKLNIRTFTRKYSDYKGRFYDNPVRLVLEKRPLSIKNHSIISKVKELLDKSYVGAYVKYESRDKFFKNFLVREQKEKGFARIGFNNRTKEHRKAVLLEAYYKGGVGKILKAVIYFKRFNIPKTYHITAIDKNGVYAVGSLIIKVPALDGEAGDIFSSSSVEEEYLYGELEGGEKGVDESLNEGLNVEDGGGNLEGDQEEEQEEIWYQERDNFDS